MYCRIKNYTDIWDDLPYLNEDGDSVWLPYPFSYAEGASYLIYNKVSFFNVQVYQVKEWDNFLLLGLCSSTNCSIYCP